MKPFPDELLQELITAFAFRTNLHDVLKCSTIYDTSLLEDAKESQRCLEDFIADEDQEKYEKNALKEVKFLRCRLCGVLLSSAIKDEIQQHLSSRHAKEFRSVLQRLLRNRDNALRSAVAKKEIPMRRSRLTHPIWKHYMRASELEAICMICLGPVKCGHTTNLVRHMQYHHNVELIGQND